MGTHAAAKAEVIRLKTGGPRGVLARLDPKTISSGSGAGDNLVIVQDVRRTTERQSLAGGADAGKDLRAPLRYEVGSSASFPRSDTRFT